MSNKHQTVTVTVANRTIIRIIIIIAATFLGFRFIMNISHPLTLIFFAFFLALALNPAVSWISRHLKIKSRAAATGIAYISVLAILTAFMIAVVPPLFRQTRDFITNLPTTIESVQDKNTGLGRIVNKYGLQESVDSFASDMRSRIKHLPAPVLSTASRIGSGLVSTIAVLVMTFMMLVEGPMWMDMILRLQPPKKRAHRRELAEQMYQIVTNYVNGQILIAAIAAVFAMVAMMIASNIFGVSINAIGLAGIIALTGLIPMIGNTLGAVIVVLVCALTSFPLAITMAIFFLVYQQIENVTIQPYIQSRKNELTPLLVFIAALCGIGLGGLIGGFVAIPLAACLRLLAKDFYRRRLDKIESPA
jgi:predicted PurR-regulated permease PerM